MVSSKAKAEEEPELGMLRERQERVVVAKPAHK
jgi:hypothetical protein